MTTQQNPSGGLGAADGRVGVRTMQRQPLELDRILRLPELLQVTGLSTATLYRWMDEERFPRPVRLGENSVGWKASAVQAWIDGLEEVATKPQPEAGGERAATAHRSRRNSGRQSVGNR